MHSPSHHAHSSNTASNTRTRHPHTDKDLEAASHPSLGAEVQAPPPDAVASMAAFPEAACPAEARPCPADHLAECVCEFGEHPRVGVLSHASQCIPSMVCR